jgi:predicted transcriptional regulator of viral defense system
MREELQRLARKKGVIRAKDAENAGISRVTLYRQCQAGHLKKIGKGLFALPDYPETEHLSLIEVANRAPNAVVCLLSALSFHGITTQIPSDIWVAVPRGSWVPSIQNPRLTVIIVSGAAFGHGIQEHIHNGVTLRVYSPAKTIADCFKFRNKVGLDVAIEALKEGWRKRMATMDELTEAARICRMERVMRPYMDAIV